MLSALCANIATLQEGQEKINAENRSFTLSIADLLNKSKNVSFSASASRQEKMSHCVPRHLFGFATKMELKMSSKMEAWVSDLKNLCTSIVPQQTGSALVARVEAIPCQLVKVIVPIFASSLTYKRRYFSSFVQGNRMVSKSLFQYAYGLEEWHSILLNGEGRGRATAMLEANTGLLPTLMQILSTSSGAKNRFKRYKYSISELLVISLYSMLCSPEDREAKAEEFREVKDHL